MNEVQNENLEQLKLASIVNIFNRLFEESENTILKSGAKEPFYKAGKVQSNIKAHIYSRENFLSSALHEIAHWAIAGSERREKDDFGYWYAAEGRSVEQQKAFEKVEVKPQAVEWLLSLACNHPFHYSADNLTNDISASQSFKTAVKQQSIQYLDFGIPQRAQCLIDEFTAVFRAGQDLKVAELEQYHA
ncbi:MAG: elongation factor P hydroxylase [Kangiellaceae bacterium]